MGKVSKAKKYYEKAIAVKAGTEEAVQADKYLTELSGNKKKSTNSDDNSNGNGNNADNNADDTNDNTGEN